MTGTATERDYSSTGGGSIIIGGGNPWYGYGSGYYPYNPWGAYYGYGYYPYSMFGYYDSWYDPWYGGGGGSYSSSSSGSSSYSSSLGSESEHNGSLRLRVNPAHAKVYLDGTLIGTVDEFDGLSNHLAAEAGTHQLELRADGYVSYTTTVKVEAGKTITARASLKKKNE